MSSVSMKSPELLHFPSESEILNYLNKHPKTNDPWTKEKKINEFIAKNFADEELYPSGVEMRLVCDLHDINKSLKMPNQEAFIMIFMKAISGALIDCAHEHAKKSEEKQKEASTKTDTVEVEKKS
jgi:hypothetical protein